MQNSITKSPRLYTELDLKAGQDVELTIEQVHYLRNVLRRNPQDAIRLFNGRDGEWLCTLTILNKKNASAQAIRQTREQTATSRRIHAYFPPIKKNRMDFLIEKAVELGVTDLYPIITSNTEIHKLNEDRLRAHIIEAAEQCERLDLPKLHSITQAKNAIHNSGIPIHAAIERHKCKNFHPRDNQDIAVLIGPEGGFTTEETKMMLDHQNVIGVSLGNNILRAETALIKLLSLI